MMINKFEKLPKQIPIFPLSNFIFFPNTTVPLNIFEKRYLDMINDSIKTNRIIGMIQPKNNNNPPDLYQIGCMGKITSFNETDDGRYIIILNGLCRFKILEELNNDKLYREFIITSEDFKNDLNKNYEEIKFKDLELIFKNLKNYLKKQGYILNWKELEKQDLEQSINTLSMAAPFSLEERQALLESKDIKIRKKKIEEILNTYLLDDFSNTTIQ